MNSNTRTERLAIAVATAAAGALLAGCGSGTGSSSPAPAPAAPTATAAGTPDTAHNDADVKFATDMIPHHAQAVSMSGLAKDRASSPQVKDLATRIEAAQQPEIDQMTAWLKAWNAPVPSAQDPASGGMHGMGPGSMQQMPGMMSSGQMQQLNESTSAAFDTMFLQMMISHHEGAITMAKTELSAGRNAEAKALAERIINAQQAEITEMRALLAKG
jgi:uncharacterized protein (DUF305 family)